MRPNPGRGPTRVEVLGTKAAVEDWTEITAGREVEVVASPSSDAFPRADSELAVAMVAPDEAARIAGALASGVHAAAQSVALLLAPTSADHSLTAFARALAQAKHDWEQAFDAIVDPVAILGPDGRVRRANRALTACLALSFDKVVGAAYQELLGQASPPPCPIAEALETGQPLVRETRFSRLTGLFQVTLSPLSTRHERPGAVAILKDVTALKDQEERLGLAHRLADIGRLAGGVAHEISTPLASIALRAESLLRRAQDAQLTAVEAFKDFPRYLGTIEEETFRCKRIIGALLEFSRPRRPEVVANDLNALAEKAASLVADQMKAKQVSLSLELAPSLPWLMIDAAQLREALIALLLNALDACERGGKVGLETSALPGERVRLLVRDNGSGIAPENLDKVVTPFFTTKPLGQGTGLGLSICDSVVRAHGGELRIESAQGQGTQVALILPLRQAPAEEPRRSPAPPTQP